VRMRRAEPASELRVLRISEQRNHRLVRTDLNGLPRCSALPLGRRARPQPLAELRRFSTGSELLGRIQPLPERHVVHLRYHVDVRTLSRGSAYQRMPGVSS
jgi:hypothetical protein